MGFSLHALYMEHQSKESLRVPTVSCVLPDGRIVELVYARDRNKTMLAVSDGVTHQLLDELEMGDGTHLVPIAASNNLIKHDAIVFPERPESYGDVGALILEIEHYIDRYVVLDDWFRRCAAYYVLFSWVYDAFEELPYLRVQAEWGSGKTRALIVIGSLCYRAFFASGASTVSPIFHTLDTFRGTLILDEADFRFSDQTAELTKILNNGNVRGFPVFRTAMTLKREFDPRAFQVFGPKFIAMRKSFADEALESRFITGQMQAIRVRPDIPINLPKVQREEAQTLRNKLLQYRFDNRFRVSADESLVDPTLSPRMNQILVPLLSIVPDQAARNDIRQALITLENERAISRSTSTEAELLEILLELNIAGSGKPVPIADIAVRFQERYAKDYDRPITNRYIGSILRTRLGLKTYKSHSVYLVVADVGQLATLSTRYGIAADSTIKSPRPHLRPDP